MIDLIRNRRSIRKYTNQSIEVEKIELLRETALRAPTSRNLKPCKFIFVQDKNVLNLLSKAKEHGSTFLKDAALGIVIYVNEQVSDVWIEDASIASILIQLQAQALGLGSCWIQIRKRNHNSKITSEDYIKELLELDDKIKVESIISIGYPAEKKTPLSYKDLNFEKIIDI